jgi:uncharacterized protein
MIGIMADTHDNMDSIRKAVQLFNKEEVELVIHAGDLISPFTAGEFQKLNSKLFAIFGNNDGERDGLKKAYRKICPLEDFKELSVNGKSIAVIHGTNEALVDALARSGNYDVVVRGHTHKLKIINGITMTINPGETCGYLSGDETVVLLDPVHLSYEVVYL